MTDEELDLIEAALKLFQDGELYGQQTASAKTAMRAFKKACAVVTWQRTPPATKKKFRDYHRTRLTLPELPCSNGNVFNAVSSRAEREVHAELKLPPPSEDE